MSANSQPKDPLPDDARAALDESGSRLLAQLDALRSDTIVSDSELAPLDPQAELALRRSGDGLLSQLEGRRASLALTKDEIEIEPTRARWIWRRGAGIAAAFAGLLAVVQFNATPPEETVRPQVSVKQRKDELHTHTVIPEPSGAMLGILGASLLLYRRRR